MASAAFAGFMIIPISQQKYCLEKVGVLIWILSQDSARYGKTDLKGAASILLKGILISAQFRINVDSGWSQEEMKMGKYANHEEFGINAPINYREDSTSESFLRGMSAIAPSGMKPKPSRGKKFEEKTDFKASARWHKNFDLAMFGGSDIGTSNYESNQMSLEGKINGVKRIPGRH
nr:hypothetical protein [Dehalococcoides mccartyi]